MSNIAKQSIKSSWTPLSREETNHKIFDERRSLVGKWFDKWTDEQRKAVITDLVSKCKNKQLFYAGELINNKKPIHKGDFTRAVPRVVSLYIYSYLDPRSLSRCSQVCWYWKYLSQLDQLWMPKCMRLGWILSFSPSPYESGIWKKLYIENIMALKVMAPRKHHKDVQLKDFDTMSSVTDSTRKSSARSLKSTGVGGKIKQPPWRGTDPNPKDMWRNNVLDNEDEKERVDKLRKKHVYGPLAEEILKKAKNKVRTGEHAAMIKAIHTERQQINGRPDWARQNSGAPFVNQLSSVRDAAIRPEPVVAFKKPPTPKRSSNTKPSYIELNTSPWHRSGNADSDN